MGAPSWDGIMRLSGGHEMRLRAVASQMSKPRQASIVGEHAESSALSGVLSPTAPLQLPAACPANSLSPNCWGIPHTLPTAALPWPGNSASYSPAYFKPSRARGSGQRRQRERNPGPLCTMQPWAPPGMEPARTCHHPGSESPASTDKSLSAPDR